MKHDAILLWLNGLGYSTCTQEYADAVELERDLMYDLRESENPDAYAELYEEAHRASAAVVKLQAAGHLGSAYTTAGLLF